MFKSAILNTCSILYLLFFAGIAISQNTAASGAAELLAGTQLAAQEEKIYRAAPVQKKNDAPHAPNRIYRYTALTENPVKKMSGGHTVNAAGVNWSCKGIRCTANISSRVPEVTACQALARQIGSIRRYGHPGKMLSQLQLKQCNQGIAAGTPSGMEGGKTASMDSQTTKQEDLTTDGQEQHRSKDATKIAPRVRPIMPSEEQAGIKGDIKPGSTIYSNNDKQPKIQPRIGDIPSIPPDIDVYEIRRRADSVSSSPFISKVVDEHSSLGPYGCIRNPNRNTPVINIHGSNFGSRGIDAMAHENGPHVVIATSGMRSTVLVRTFITRWEDSVITAIIPEHAMFQPGDNYRVGIMDNNNRWLTVWTKEIMICPGTYKISGKIRISNCNLVPSDIQIDVEIEYGGHTTYTAFDVVPVSGDSFLMQYKGELRFRAPEMKITLVPDVLLTENVRRNPVCDVGTWSPGRKQLTVNYENPSATQDFTYTVSASE
jgi:hypothetical protein